MLALMLGCPIILSLGHRKDDAGGVCVCEMLCPEVLVCW